MSTAPQRTERPTPPDPDAVSKQIARLAALEEQQGPVVFAEALADNIMDPDPVESAAFRSDELAYKSLVAARYLTTQGREVLRGRRRGSPEEHATKRYLNKVALERQMLEAAVAGIRARQGVLVASPNPRRRAERRLASENLAGPTPQGRFNELLLEEREKEAEKKRAQKRARRAARPRR